MFSMNYLNTISILCRFNRKISTGVCFNQKVSAVLRMPRNFRRASEETIEQQPKTKVNIAEDIKEIEDNLFDNNQVINNAKFKVDEMLKQYKKMDHKRYFAKSEEAERKEKPRYKDNFKPTNLDIETMNDVKRTKIKIKSDEIFDENLKIKYIKLHKDDKLAMELNLLLNSSKIREKNSKLALEGKRLIIDALDAGLQMDYFLFDHLEKLQDMRKYLLKKNLKIVQIKRHIIKEWSDLVTPPGLTAIFSVPSDMKDIVAKNTTIRLPATVICDNIREPSNLGSIIRTCAAVGISRVILLKGCTNPWDMKCLRGGAGSHFRVSIEGPIKMENLSNALPADATFFVANNQAESKNIMFLNSSYDSVDYTKASNPVIFIGGETHGISKEVFEFIEKFSVENDHEQNNYIIRLPLENGVESLNASSALSVILYEFRRQFSTQ